MKKRHRFSVCAKNILNLCTLIFRKRLTGLRFKALFYALVPAQMLICQYFQAYLRNFCALLSKFWVTFKLFFHTIDTGLLISFSGVSHSDSSSSVEQERYLNAIVNATPLSVLRQGSAWGMSDSSLSLNSLLMAAEDATNTLTPEASRRSSHNPFNKAIGTMG